MLSNSRVVDCFVLDAVNQDNRNWFIKLSLVGSVRFPDKTNYLVIFTSQFNIADIAAFIVTELNFGVINLVSAFSKDVLYIQANDLVEEDMFLSVLEYASLTTGSTCRIRSTV